VPLIDEVTGLLHHMIAQLKLDLQELTVKKAL
jgi:hypothetical protein